MSAPGFSSPRARMAAWVVVYVGLGLVVLGLLYTVSEVRQTSDAIRTTQLDNKATLSSAERAAQAAERGTDRIEDCTTVGGKCYEEQQAAAGEFVGTLNEGTLRVVVAALSCQEDGVTGQKALARCTVRRSAEKP